MRKTKCTNCKEVKTEKGSEKCYSCKVSGCQLCIKVVCCDCGVSMCKDCGGNGDSNCGCYGNCSSCETNINRGENGWPCCKCKKWYCSECRSNSKCKECRMDDD